VDRVSRQIQEIGNEQNCAKTKNVTRRLSGGGGKSGESKSCASCEENGCVADQTLKLPSSHRRQALSPTLHISTEADSPSPRNTHTSCKPSGR